MKTRLDILLGIVGGINLAHIEFYTMIQKKKNFFRVRFLETTPQPCATVEKSPKNLCAEKRSPVKRESLLNAKELLVYPNPTSDLLNIQITGENTGIAQLKVYDSYGRTVVDIPFNLEDAHKELGVKEWNSGIYFVKVESLEGVYSAKVIVIQ